MMRICPDFAATFVEREDFAGVEIACGIEGVVDAAHQSEVGIGEEQRHEFGFFHAHAVFSRERASDFDTITNDFGGGLHGAFELSAVARVEENNRMEIAVASVKDVADLKAELRADVLDAREGLRKFGTRDDAVKNVIAGR